MRPGLTVRVDGGALRYKVRTPRPFLTGTAGAVRPGDEWTQNYSVSSGFVLRF
jgi:hypothetical protein